MAFRNLTLARVSLVPNSNPVVKEITLANTSGLNSQYPVHIKRVLMLPPQLPKKNQVDYRSKKLSVADQGEWTGYQMRVLGSTEQPIVASSNTFESTSICVFQYTQNLQRVTQTIVLGLMA